MNRLIYAALASMPLMACDAIAQSAYKCDAGNGKFTYSDRPCPSSSKQREVNVTGNTLDASGSRELLLREENERLLRENSELRQQRPPSVQLDRPPERQTNTALTEDCKQAKRSYEVLASSYSPKKKELEARRSEMFIARGQKEPDTIIIKPPDTKRDCTGPRDWNCVKKNPKF